MVLVPVICALTLIQFVSTIPWDPDCGKSKGCFPYCPNGCKYLVTWHHVAGTTVDFTLQAEQTDQKTNALAIGFSKDRRMGDDSGIFFHFYRYGYVFSNSGLKSHRLHMWDREISFKSSWYIDSVFTCNFTRYSTLSNDKRIFDFRYRYIIMLLYLEADDDSYDISKAKHYSIPWMSEGIVNFLEHTIEDEYKLNSPLVKLHGIMMVIAWLFFSTLGIFTARYCKHILPNYRIRGEKLWFQIHRFVMLMVMLCVCVGIVAIFVENKGYSQITLTKAKVLVNWHPIIGLIVTVLCFINPLMSLLRPDIDHRLRWVFNWAHLCTGVLTQTLAVAAILLGYFMERTVVYSVVYVTVGHLMVIIIYYALMEVHTKLYSKTNMNRASNTEDKTLVSSQNQLKLATLATMVFTFSFGLTILNAVLIGQG